MAELFIPREAFNDNLRMPALGSGLWLNHTCSTEALACRLDHFEPRHLDILTDLRSEHCKERLSAVMRLCAQRSIELWLYVICPDTSPREALLALSRWLQEEPMPPAGMLLTPAAYLKSYQPDGHWPTSATPAQVLAIGRELWPHAKLGGGVPTYFTELNRCRPNPAHINFITHATSPTVHAADDLSVIESLESLPFIFSSCQALAPLVPYRVTTSAIGAWTNPYGDSLTNNDGTQRVTLSDQDPRQRGLFAAAWNLGYIAQAAAAGVTSLTLSSLGPPFDVAGTQGWYPVFHVLRGLAPASHRGLLLASLSDDGLAAVAWRDGHHTELWLANCSDEPLDVSLIGVRRCRIAMLHASNVSTGQELPDLLDNMSPMSTPKVTLERLSVARLVVELES